MKKSYVVPEMRMLCVQSCGVFATSGIESERYNYLCPYIPETRCREYNRFLRHKRGVSSESSVTPKHERVSVKGDVECPYRNTCEDYQLFLKITNERQR